MGGSVNPHTAEWMVDLIKHGQEAFQDLGEENPLGMMDVLSERAVMDKVATLLYGERMSVAKELPSGIIALGPGRNTPPISLYGAIRWAEMNGYARCNACDDAVDHLGDLEPSNRCIESRSSLVGLVERDAYLSQTSYGSGFRREWLTDQETLDIADRLLVRRSPLQFVRINEDEMSELVVTGERPLTREEVVECLWLRELRIRDIVLPGEDRAREIFQPASLVYASLNDWTHCRPCYGRGNFLPVSPTRVPRKKCEKCGGTGRVRRRSSR